MSAADKTIKFFDTNKFLIIAMLFYLVITIPKMLGHYTFADEGNAWMVAQKMHIDDFMYYLKGEGHPILWFLCIMPFAKANFHYPYSMFFVNYFFTLLTLVVMWKIAPFKTITKFIITFSSLFIEFYSVYARGYTIGILGLFLLAALREKQMKHPVWYAIIIVLTAHVNFLSALAASWFGIFFIYELIKTYKKDWKKYVYPLTIILCGIIFWVMPVLIYKGFGYGYIPISNKEPSIVEFVKFFLYYNSDYITTALYIAMLAYLLVKSTNFARGFLIYTHVIVFLTCVFVFPLGFHNMYYLYIYMIITLWLNEYKAPMKPAVTLLFAALMFMPVTTKLNYVLKDHPDYDSAKEYIMQMHEKSPKPIVFDNWFIWKTLEPYMTGYDIKFSESPEKPEYKGHYLISIYIYDKDDFPTLKQLPFESKIIHLYETE